MKAELPPLSAYNLVAAERNDMRRERDEARARLAAAEALLRQIMRGDPYAADVRAFLAESA